MRQEARGRREDSLKKDLVARLNRKAKRARAKIAGLEARLVAIDGAERVQQEEALNAFEAAVQSIPEIVECYTVSGDRDFLLRVVVEDVTAYERLLKSTLVHLPEVANMSSTFALRQVKYTTELPLGSSQLPLGSSQLPLGSSQLPSG